jgi:hypothetical protein
MALGPIQLRAQGAHDRLSPGEKLRLKKYGTRLHLVSTLRNISPLFHMHSWLIHGQFHLIIYRYSDLFIYAVHSTRILNFSTVYLLSHLLIAGQADTIQFMVGTTFHTSKPIKKNVIHCKSVGNK